MKPTRFAQTFGLRGAIFALVLAVVVSAAIAVRSPAGVIASGFSAPRTLLPARIVPAELVNVSAEVAGTLTSVQVTPGSKVTPGQVIAVIASPEASANLARAEARWHMLANESAPPPAGPDPRYRKILEEQLTAARRVLDSASERLAQFSLDGVTKAYQDARKRREDVDRLLREKSLATKVELASAETQVDGALRDLTNSRQLLSRLQQDRDSAASQVKVLTMQLELPGVAAPNQGEVERMALEKRDAAAALVVARKQVEGQTVRARSAGTVLAVKVRPGDFAWVGSPVATIGDLGQLALEAALTADMAAKIGPGTPVTVRLPNDPTVVRQATVASVTLVPDQAQQSYQLRTIIPNPNPAVILVGLEGAIELQHTGRVK